MARVLITGAEGFTGRHLAVELRAAGHDVIGIGLGVDALGEMPYTKTDLCNKPGLASAVDRAYADIVVHLAGVSFIPHGDVEEIYRSNVIGTRNLLESLAHCQRRPRTVLLVSSGTIYGNSTADAIDESALPAPLDDYSVSKLAMEYVAALWSQQLPIVIVRPFGYTGVGQAGSFLLPKIVSHFKQRRKAIELGNLEVVREFRDVRSAVRDYRLLLDVAAPGEVFNVCSGKAHSVSEVLETMRDISGHALEIQKSAAHVRANEILRLVGSRRKLERQIGTAAEIPLRETLRWMYESA